MTGQEFIIWTIGLLGITGAAMAGIGLWAVYGVESATEFTLRIWRKQNERKRR